MRLHGYLSPRIMAAIQSVDSACEVALCRELWHGDSAAIASTHDAAGTPLPDRPDLVFVSQRIAVFVDGDFGMAEYLRRGAGIL